MLALPRGTLKIFFNTVLFLLSKEMSNSFLRVICYFLLIIVKLVLKIVSAVCYAASTLILYVLQKILDAIMTESTKKRKRSTAENSNQTVDNRSIIDVNWQNFLLNNFIMDMKTEKPAQENHTQHFTGTFRRAKKKKSKNHNLPHSVQNDLKTLNINKGNLDTNSKSVVNLDSELDVKVNNTVNNNKPNGRNQQKLTKFIAMDCEMVGIGYGGNDHMLARVSLVNKFGDCIYDKFVKPREEVIDYRTDISGVRKEDLLNGEDFMQVQRDVAELIKGRVLVGHSLKNDLSVLFLSHPKKSTRDTSRYKPFRHITKGSTPSLKRLAKDVLGIDIQHGEHSSVEDARAAMQLYCTVAKNWEGMMSEKRGGRKIVDED